MPVMPTPFGSATREIGISGGGISLPHTGDCHNGYDPYLERNSHQLQMNEDEWANGIRPISHNG
jgi:hypothetical protein